MSSAPTRLGPRFLRLALVGALVALIVWQVDLPLALDYLHADLMFAAAGMQPLVAVVLFLNMLRLRLLLGSVGTGPLTTMKALVLSSGMNVVIPGRLAELLKVTYLRDHGGVPASAALAAVFLERLTDVIILGFLAVGSMSLALAEPRPGFVVLTVVAIAALLLLPRVERFVPTAVRIVPSPLFRATAIRINAHLVARVKDRTIYGALGYSVLLWFVSMVNVYLFLHLSGNSSIGVSGAVVVFVLSMLGGAIPALPGGFGTFEAGAVFALHGYGYPVEKALPLALALHGAQIALPLMLALAVAASERTGIASLVRDAVAVARRTDTE